MTAANNTQVQPSQVTPPPPQESPLQKLIDGMSARGDTLELIVLMASTNPEGIGAMDITSQNIAGITAQSNILSQVQGDIITLNSILSKIESQLCNVSKFTSKTWAKFSKTLLNQFQTTYKKLFISDSSNPVIPNGMSPAQHYSDIAMLSKYQAQFPSLDPVVKQVEGWQKVFESTTGGSNSFQQDLLSPNFSTQWGGTDPSNPTNPFVKDLQYLANLHFNANNKTGSPGTDLLQNWWTSGNTGQQLASGQSQEDSTEVQSFMQLLQGFDSASQQTIQLASTQKSQMIQNEKTS